MHQPRKTGQLRRFSRVELKDFALSLGDASSTASLKRTLARSKDNFFFNPVEVGVTGDVARAATCEEATRH